MRQSIVVAGLLLASLLAGCAPSVTTGPPTSRPATPPRSASPSAASPVPVASVGLVTPSGALTPRALPTGSVLATPSLLSTPSVVVSPSITPTPGPPTQTPTPAPSDATLEDAQDLDAAILAFAQAAATGDNQSILRAQQKLLDAANKASADADADQSSYGQQLRSALGAVQAGSGGDFDRLNEAHQDLVKIIGTTGTPVANLPRPAQQSQQSLSDSAQSLRRAIDAYNQAANGGSPGDLLRAQRDLLAAADTADAATKNLRSPQADQVRRALGAIHDGFGGDTGKFADAASILAAMPDQNATATVTPTVAVTATPTVALTPTPTASATPTIAATASATPTVSASETVSPTPTASTTPTPTTSPGTATAAGASADLQPLQSGLDGQLQALQNDRNSADPGTLQRDQDGLRQAIQKANDALADDHSPAADRFRAALSTARSAADGDFSKIQAARDQLQAATRPPG